MPEPATLLVFSLAALALIVVPGPNILYIVTRSVELGRPARRRIGASPRSTWTA